MRIFTSIIFFITTLILYADNFSIFEKNGYYGIKDEEGNVTVPPVYEKLGWSDGTSEIHNGVIGICDKNIWGLISIRNKRLAEQIFYSIEPISPNFFRTSLKEKFSNKLFYGILDSKGNTIISFDYFSIEPMGLHWLVSHFKENHQQFGVISFESEVLIPIKYNAITESNRLFLARLKDHTIDLYNATGEILQMRLDSLSFDSGWCVYRDGYAGFLSPKGKITHDFKYKDFSKNGTEFDPIPFPKWHIYKKNTLFLIWECDSLSINENGLLLGYLNGAHHFVLNNKSLIQNHEFILKDVVAHHLIVQNSKTRRWSVLEEDGKSLISGYDSIAFIKNFYAGLKQSKWYLLDLAGKLKNQLPYQQLNYGIGNQLTGKRNGHWGIIDNSSDEIGILKYDSIISARKHYVISYLNQWGAMDTTGQWILWPEYSEIIPHGDLLTGRRGRGYTIYKGGTKRYKTTARPLQEIGSFTLIWGENGKYGLLNAEGNMEVYPEYDTIQLWSDHYELKKNGISSLLNSDGEWILKYNEGYQDVLGYGEGYFSVIKDNRMGFVDNKGRLRISNRYDKVRPFQEGMAPISLRGKWGFIDKSEQIRIQPYYKSISAFQNGKSIVEINGRYGLVDMGGNEVLKLKWKFISRLSTGNYLVQDTEGKFGLADKSGIFILRPAYNQLEDYGDQILVCNNNNWGVLDSKGQQLFKLDYSEIRVIKDYLMIRK